MIEHRFWPTNWSVWVSRRYPPKAKRFNTKEMKETHFMRQWHPNKDIDFPRKCVYIDLEGLRFLQPSLLCIWMTHQETGEAPQSSTQVSMFELSSTYEISPSGQQSQRPRHSLSLSVCQPALSVPQLSRKHQVWDTVRSCQILRAASGAPESQFFAHRKATEKSPPMLCAVLHMEAGDLVMRSHVRIM